MSETKSPRKIFYIIAVIIPLALLAIVEAILRLVSYKPIEPLFVEANNLPGYMQPNQNVIHRFFPTSKMAPNVSPDTQYFMHTKPKDSFRIVVQGGSTAAGFPYGRWGSLSGMLQQRFKRLYPEKNIEIINTAMSSVNSFTLLDFVDEIIAIKPDMILIYAGHNEYLGVMGVGSAYASRSSYSAKILSLKLKNFKLYRLVESIYYATFAASNEQSVTNSSNGQQQRSLMAQIAKDKDIEFGSELYQAGIEQFEQNMSLILNKYLQNEIPVIIGNLVSNEKDLTPFSGLTNATSKASIEFEKGHDLLNEGQFIQAKVHFDKARDYDTLRFRAPSEFNKIINKLTKRDLVFFADVDTAIRQDSTDRLIGKKHMLEHLHPTVRGYFLLGDAYLKAMFKHNLIPFTKNDELYSSLQNIEAWWAEQPVSKADSLYGEFKIARLTADYPFSTIPKVVSMPSIKTPEQQALHWREQGRSWLKINQQLLVDYQKQQDFSEAAKIAGLLADALPNQFQSTYVAGMLYKKIDNIPLSNHHLLRAVALKPEQVNAQLSLAQNYYLDKQFAKSLAILQQVKVLQPAHPQVDKLIQMVKQAK